MKLGNWPNYDKDELDAVNKVLQSGCVNYWTGIYPKNLKRICRFCWM